MLIEILQERKKKNRKQVNDDKNLVMLSVSWCFPEGQKKENEQISKKLLS